MRTRRLAITLGLFTALGFCSPVWASQSGPGQSKTGVSGRSPIVAPGTRTKLSGYQTITAARLSCGASAVVWHRRGTSTYSSKRPRGVSKQGSGYYICKAAARAHHLRKVPG
ncbi:hypothetical protein [Acidiphilium acidophilum]|uniref:hypothetical protein n=1 Tax=Acidiphilium acidophilum TaxID=76588 RepID=UPI002E8E6434|nr:hypothetical protein [Acidiphilium acidophilum]